MSTFRVSMNTVTILYSVTAHAVMGLILILFIFKLVDCASNL